MAWRRPREAPRAEAPEWYRVYHPEDWDEPDPQERVMMAGNLGLPWPDELHRAHCERRWGEAKHLYRRSHPALAEQEFAELLDEARRPQR